MKSKRINGFIFWLASLTWGLPMTLIGALVAFALIYVGYTPKRFGYLIYFEVGEKWGGVELGAFFIVNKNASEHIKQHEAGHGIQNIMFGFLMPFIVCIPSATRYWIREYKKRKGLAATLPPYDSIWFEGQATRLGKKHFAQNGGVENE